MTRYDINIDLALVVEAADADEAMAKVRHAIEKLPLCHEDITAPQIAEELFIGEYEWAEEA